MTFVERNINERRSLIFLLLFLYSTVTFSLENKCEEIIRTIDEIRDAFIIKFLENELINFSIVEFSLQGKKCFNDKEKILLNIKIAALEQGLACFNQVIESIKAMEYLLQDVVLLDKDLQALKNKKDFNDQLIKELKEQISLHLYEK